MPRRLALAVCFGVPAAVLAGSFVWLALDHGTPRLWGVVVHESGRYTLRGTVFYHAHFLREVPTAIAYALFLLGVSGSSVLRFGNSRANARVLGRVSLIGAAALVAWALVATSRADGWGSALQDLLQHRTRDDLVGYGTHWRYHWLATLWFGATVGLAPALGERLLGVSALRTHPRWGRVAWGYFLLLTVVFGLSSDVFLDPRYVGHQAREILTHGPVTALLGIGVLHALHGGGGESGAGRPHAPRTLRWIAGALFLLVPAYLATVGLAGDVMAEGQTGQGLAAMVGAHYFEHTLDYVLVILLLGAGLGGRRSIGPSRALP
jgi:hypothetical protein